MSSPLGVARIGLEDMRRTHLKAYHAAAAAGLPCRLVAVCSDDPRHLTGAPSNAGNLSAITGQKAVVIAHLDSDDPKLAKNFFNYNAEPGRKLVSSFTQGPVTDYSNANIFWGDVGAPAADADFASLSVAQKKLVAASLGYAVYEGGAWYNPDAPSGQRLVTAFAVGQAADFDLGRIDWGGPPAPGDDASFEQLSAAQRAVVAAHLGYVQVDRQVFYNPAAQPGQQIRVDFTQGSGADYENKNVAWGDVKAPADATAFSALDYAQQNKVLAHLGYSRWDGVVYFDADALPERQYRLSFEQGEGKDYRNGAIVWSAVPTPLLSHTIDVVAVPVDGQTYVIDIDGIEIRYTARADDSTTAHLVAGLVDAINTGGQFGATAVGSQIRINDGEALGKAVITTSVGAVGAIQSRDVPFQALTAEQQFRVLDQTGGNQSEAARILGIHRDTLRARMQRYKIPIPPQDRSKR